MTEAQSKIGRKSRRKGKSYECMMARQFREWFGHKWETSRNSGRTDIPGDIYCVDRQTRIMVECKHRKTWEVSDIIRGNKAYRKNFDEVIHKWEACIDEYPILLVFRKDEYGTWVLGKRYMGGADPLWTPDRVFKTTAAVRGEQSEKWFLVKDVRGNHEQFIYQS